MGSIIRKLLNHYYRDVLNRINDIETGIDVLVNSPSYIHSAGVGFNGIKGRKQIFSDLIDEGGGFKTIIETGTYLGDTSGYMATAAGIPVLTCEYNTKLYSLAKMRLNKLHLVKLYNIDSRSFLRDLSKDTNITNRECFFYLDAHWGKDLPLKEEIQIIISCWDKFIIMIDDFKVPDDDGYKHDSYGTLEFIEMPKLRTIYNLRSFFPKIRACEEPIPPTGCVVLARNDDYGSRLNSIKSLRLYSG
jgi:hypothetical protein